ncbi:N-acetyl-glucosamine transferase [Leifsonia xyli subsp. cynodontis DSM 46306]|uniref:Multidrug transporter n=1 Tax=Leifsonia xyli subsp. cynodontis DSM 46306 TaxID=1389489 RepID=U3PAL4_LEIXC|nr:glycosyltransferase [Leifsonia xyli]AGW40523.1 N-acetyl-glucosamine transferase [Leifsonia xyli subsp. cynodontis DSM 46306]
MIGFLKALTFLLGASFFAYVLFILIPHLTHRKTALGDPADFQWHFFVPCRDEAAVIERTVEAARRDFPAVHVWVVDDHSDDDTGRIVEEIARRDPRVHLVARRRPEARTGKGDALNAAYDALNAFLPADADRERIIVMVLDADGELSPRALAMMASADVFLDPGVGGAQVVVWMKNRHERRPRPGRGWLGNLSGRFLVKLQDIEFRTIIAAMQSLRARTGTVGLGGNGQFARLSVLDLIRASHDRPWHGALLEDYELGLHIHLHGYRIAHVGNAHVSQEALPSFRRFLTQRTRWAQGNIQCVKYVRDAFRSAHVTNVGLLEIGYYLVLPFLQLCGLAAFAVMIVTALLGLTKLGAGLPGGDRLIWLAVFWIVFSVVPFAVWGFVYRRRCERISFLGALGWGLGVSVYVLYMYVVIPRAFWRILTGRSGWLKTRRNAETSTGPTALDH